MVNLVGRRRAMIESANVLDTSPIIEVYDTGIPSTNPQGTAPRTGCCVTALYEYPKQSYIQTIVITGGYGTHQGVMALYTDGVFKDWWGTSYVDNYERQCINAGTNGLKISLSMDRLNDAYAYLKETGQILFAGKNSIYYGHTNISELS